MRHLIPDLVDPMVHYKPLETPVVISMVIEFHSFDYLKKDDGGRCSDLSHCAEHVLVMLELFT